ncbi:tRNA pseudouridine(38-40) synthase TruA [Pararhodonellum marinum]|uniref:tRNA pseudouridine(38-40) synthase TruA n=1 Tax=Pararhodonellum marinum TaxID=2755358 RepID=UPI0018906585|nr:tRNA pseudouridine(38-40) synthase TruA [Pararhodonellum marinum]
MKTKPHTYFFRIQYLGLGYHGWQKQPNVKTIQGQLERVLGWVLGHDQFNILGASRTDTGVSCQNGAFELFSSQILDPQATMQALNQMLPAHIRILEAHPISPAFNIIQHVYQKEYHYHFSFGEKFHPFGAATLAYFPENLNLQDMIEGAGIFQGRHDFRRFCIKPNEETIFLRDILVSEIIETAPFISAYHPQQSFCFRVKSSGFLRNQVRLMMGALWAVGRGDLSLHDLEAALESEIISPLCRKAPANGLILHDIEFQDLSSFLLD